MTHFASHAHIKVQFKDHILDLEIHRREKKNAFTTEMYQCLLNNILLAQQDSNVRVIYIHGQEDLFTSGNDLQELLQLKSSDTFAAFDFLKVIANCKLPIVAAVGGKAIGIGTTLLLHCDFVIAAENAQFQLPFVNLGFSPEGASSYLLPLIAGTKLSNELLMLGEFFDTQTALRSGILNATYPQEQILSQAMLLCAGLVEKPAQALQVSKRLSKKHHLKIVNDTIQEELEEFKTLLEQPAAKEILQAFQEKLPHNRDLFYTLV
jgi:enoyl-CoA hydratase/carnithine racemase